MNREEAIACLSDVSEVGAEMATPYIGDAEYLDCYGVSVLRRNAKNPVLEDINHQFVLLTARTLTRITISLEATEAVSTEYRTETRRMSRSIDVQTLPLSLVRRCQLHSESGEWRGRSSAPPEKLRLTLEIGDESLTLPLAEESLSVDDAEVRQAGDIQRFATHVIEALSR